MRRRHAERRIALGIPSEKICEECGSVYARSALAATVSNEYWLGRRFCSMACRNAWMRSGGVPHGEDHPSWKGDVVTLASSRARGQAIRKRESDGYCGRCKFMLATETHHLDEDPTNNERDNLEFLCMGCHDLAHIGETVWDPPRLVAA